MFDIFFPGPFLNLVVLHVVDGSLAKRGVSEFLQHVLRHLLFENCILFSACYFLSDYMIWRPSLKLKRFLGFCQKMWSLRTSEIWGVLVWWGPDCTRRALIYNRGLPYLHVILRFVSWELRNGENGDYYRV